MLDGVGHGDCHLNLPLFGGPAKDQVHQLRQLLDHFGADLSIDADVQACLSSSTQSHQGMIKCADHSAELVVQLSQAVKRNAKPLESGSRRFLNSALIKVAAAGLRRTIDTMGSYAA